MICSTNAEGAVPPPRASAPTIQEPTLVLLGTSLEKKMFVAVYSVEVETAGAWVTLPKEATPHGQVLKATRRSPIIGLDTLSLQSSRLIWPRRGVGPSSGCCCCLGRRTMCVYTPQTVVVIVECTPN